MIVLASASPRRAELLASAGLPFVVVPSGIVEERLPAEPPDVFVRRLAAAKARDVAGSRADGFVLGADTAVVLDGDPFKEGEAYTLRLKMPDGYKVPPHWHPTDENVTVLSGTLGAGMGDKFDPASGELIKAGGFVRMPKSVHHYAWAKGPTTIQIHGDAPFAFNYVNASDDPRNQH